MDEKLLALRDVDGYSQRFFPPGSHPALARVTANRRQAQVHLEHLYHARTMGIEVNQEDIFTVRKIIKKMDDEIAAFEEQQSEMKQFILWQIEHHA